MYLTELRRCSLQKGFRKLININTPELLDACSIGKESFQIVCSSGSVPCKVSSATYMPLEGKINILLSDDSVLRDCVYYVTSSDIKSVDGHEISLEDTSYIRPELDADIYSVSILSIYYSQAGKQLFVPPRDGNYTMYTQVVNTGRSDEDITLEYYSTSSDNEEIIKEKSISIEAGSSATVSMGISSQDGRRVKVRLR